MKQTVIGYISTTLVCVVAILAGVWMWNYYMHSPWTRDGKIRAEIVNITPEVSGKISLIRVADNQHVQKGELLFTLDAEPFKIALTDAEAAQAKALVEMDKATHEATRRGNLPKNAISIEDLDSANLNVSSTKAAYQAAQAVVAQAQWNLKHTEIVAPTDGYITNLATRVGNYANTGTPLVALIDEHSFYVLGYFEETKLPYIKENDPADITLFNGGTKLQGVVESIGRAIYDQSVDSSDNLLMNVKPNIPWVRLAQRVPVRVKLTNVPAGVQLISGTTCSIAVKH